MLLAHPTMHNFGGNWFCQLPSLYPRFFYKEFPMGNEQKFVPTGHSRDPTKANDLRRPASLGTR